MVVTTVRFSTAAACAGVLEGIGTEDRCEMTAPNTATHITITSAHAIAARRMANLLP
jgi:hypothetical protein